MSDREMACPICGEGEIMVEVTLFSWGSPASFMEPGDPPELELDWPKTGKQVQRGFKLGEGMQHMMVPAMVDEKVPVCSNERCAVNRHKQLINDDELLEYYASKMLADPESYFSTYEPYDEG